MILYNELKKQVLEHIGENKDLMIEYNDYVADHPEVSGMEYETSKHIVSLLENQGYACEYPIEDIPNSFRAIYGKNNHKYKVAVLTEYDALPEIGHGCGHCLSGAISMLAALSMRQIQDLLDVDIHIVGTPDEESEGQKCHMAEKGFFNEYDMAIMIHMYNQNIVTPRLQCCLFRDYHFYGQAAHASSAPWRGKNALNAAQLFLHAIDMLRQHTTVDAQFHGIISHGGDFPNIVPEHVVVKQIIRALDKERVIELGNYVDDCAKGASIATQTSWEKIKCGEDYYNLKFNKEGNDVIRDVYKELGIQNSDANEDTFGSSDIGNVSFYCPTFQPLLKVTDDNIPLHTREFTEAMKTSQAHEALVLGAEIISLSIIKIFSDKERIKRLKDIV